MAPGVAIHDATIRILPRIIFTQLLGKSAALPLPLEPPPTQTITAAPVLGRFALQPNFNVAGRAAACWLFLEVEDVVSVVRRREGHNIM